MASRKRLRSGFQLRRTPVPRFRLIATGGTIASRRSPHGLLAGATGAELLAQSGLGALDMEVDDFTTRGSYAFSLADLLALAKRIRDALAGGADAVVITHGTDTMEESAFLLDLFHGDRRPVVLTGAQRPFDSPAPDGPANLAAAFAVAASTHARGARSAAGLRRPCLAGAGSAQGGDLGLRCVRLARARPVSAGGPGRCPAAGSAAMAARFRS
ncbi:asparaginase domain-containing protein [Streptomyces sp. JNUCC 63]